MKFPSKQTSKHLKLTLVMITLVITSNVNAVIPPPPGLPYKPKTSVPLDGGLTALLLGAAAFGVRTLRKAKEQ